MSSDKMNVHTFIRLIETGFKYFRNGSITAEDLLVGIAINLNNVDITKTHTPTVEEELMEMTVNVEKLKVGTVDEMQKILNEILMSMDTNERKH